MSQRPSENRTVSTEIVAEAVGWRHHLHQHPELAYEEHATADFVAQRLTEAGLQVHRGLAGTGVVGTLSRGNSSRTLGIRADMDALRITEQTGAAHASRHDGVMHACGHDGHVAVALAAARVCAQMEELDGTVHFIFQPAEEGAAGARRMMEEGLFEQFPCDSVFAMHNWPMLPVGACAVLDGPMEAANAIFEISVEGRGCHAAMPDQGTDCVLAACQLVQALQSIVARNVCPLSSGLISVTQVHGGEAHNVIPKECKIRGTVRWFDSEVGDLLERRLREVAASIAQAFGCRANVHYERRYPALINDLEAARLLRTVASGLDVGLNVVDALPTMGAEDFAFMLQKVRGAYIWIGSGRGGDNPGLHSPHFDFNDAATPYGIALWIALVRSRLASA